MSTGNSENKKSKGFNGVQLEYLQSTVSDALQTERKVVVGIVEDKMREMAAQHDKRFDQIADMIRGMKVESKTPHGFQTPKQNSPVNINFTGMEGSTITVPNHTTIADTPPSGVLTRGPPTTSTTRAVPRSSVVEQPTAPVDSNQRFPSHTTPLPGTNVTPDEYALWSTQVLGGIKGLTKYDGLLDKSPEESWETFQSRNRKYSPSALEQSYLDAHKATWSYLLKSVDSGLALRIEQQMKADVRKNNLPTLLGFQLRDDSFYENVNAFWEKLKDQYLLKSHFRLGHVLRELGGLRYNGREDPKTFLSKYHQVHAQGKLLVPHFPEYEDDIKATDILEKLPDSLVFNNIKSQFYTRDVIRHPLTVKEVEDALRQWWVHQGTTVYSQEGNTADDRISKEGRDSTRKHKEETSTPNWVDRESDEGHAYSTYRPRQKNPGKRGTRYSRSTSRSPSSRRDNNTYKGQSQGSNKDEDSEEDVYDF
jgi:hypothetical protein